MSKQPSIGEVSTKSKLFLRFYPKASFIAILTAFIGFSALTAEASDAEAASVPARIETLDQRYFDDC